MEIRSTHTRIVTHELTNPYIIPYKLKQAFGPAFLLTTEKRTMNRKEFWEWLATCPTHKHETEDAFFGYITVTFKVNEEEEEEAAEC